MADAILVATLTEPPARGVLERLPPGVAWLEVRADLVGDLDPDGLRANFPGGLLYTLRSREEGGGFAGPAAERRRRLAAAARRYDLVDLEGERDGATELLAAIPQRSRLVSWHGHAPDLGSLQARFERLAAIPAAYYKLVAEAREPGEELVPLALLASLKRPDVAAFASGPGGAWTRLVAPRFGLPAVYGSVGPLPGAPGQPTVARLARDYGLPELRPAAALCGLVGDPALHSLSPRIHNAAYRELGLPLLYVPFEAASFGDFWLRVVDSGSLEVLGLPLRGLSVTSPHKEAALAVGEASPLAERIGAANTLVRDRAGWRAETTDPEGVLGPLGERGIEPRGLAAAVLGAGGAGRAAAAALAAAGANVIVVNRGRARGEEAAARLGLRYVPWDDFDPASADLLVHATPLGRDGGEPPIDPARLRAGAVVVDLVYGDGPTPLVERAAARGLTAIDGREVLLHQAVGQFRLMTGRELPREVAREALR